MKEMPGEESNEEAGQSIYRKVPRVLPDSGKIVITPEIASDFLRGSSEENRLSSDELVTRYADAMRNGEWRMPGTEEASGTGRPPADDC